MSVSPAGALVWSAVLHALGLGLAGWATHGVYSESSPVVAPRTTRAFALHYVLPIPTRARPRPQPVPPRAPSRPHPPAPATTPAPAPTPTLGRLDEQAPPRQSPSVQEPDLETVAVAATPVTSTPPAPSAVSRGVDRGAALVEGGASACPELPLPEAWAHRQLAVAVAAVVDAGGSVDRSTLRVIESPGRTPSDPGFYPRIYVVGARARVAGRGDLAGYESAVTDAVMRHVGMLEFHPALKDGRPVPSTVLIACQRSPD